MNRLILLPPLAFLIIFFFIQALSYLFSKISYRPKETSPDSRKPYACGEERYDHMLQPDYSSFFPFVFFFTIAHVATLILTTVPLESSRVLMIPLLYIASVGVGLYILFRR
ncbi:MAG: hypothetical protein PHQ96_01065 [Candidatus Omnitrophica bacterium]|nr:hypothetical protein [Candidatus Omnitrophota bacterium]